jgi:predicted dithiol-disulfide oxidoreductase (DUF899 family)
MDRRPVVSREQWLTARKELLSQEKELTRHRDRVAAARRALPWVRVEKDYVFDTVDGKRSLAGLFDGRSQLLVYHFMLTPGLDHVCSGCAFLSDHVDAARQHFENADLSFVAVSRAPLSDILPVKMRLGWKFRWVSSGGTSFNYDYGVSFTRAQIASGKVGYNYDMTDFSGEDLHGTSVFARDDAGDVFHTYSTYARGNEVLAGAFSYLDLVPKGRNENGTMSWVQLHDEYEVPQAVDCCRPKAAASRTLSSPSRRSMR